MKERKYTALLNHEKLREEMRKQGRRQEEFAEELGISDRYVRNLISEDKNVSIGLFYNISQCLAVPMADLLTCEAAEDTEQQGANKEVNQAMAVTKLAVFYAGSPQETGYYICPRCDTTLEREYVNFCDRCGQKLDWRYCRDAKKVIIS